MSRWGYESSKEVADDLRQVSVRWLKRYGYLDGTKRGGIEWTSGIGDNKDSIGLQSYISDTESYVRLIYSQTHAATGERKDFDTKVDLVTTPCNFGGVRYWFICPLYKSGVHCGRRVATLYKAGDYFGCRHCYELSYASRNEAYSGWLGDAKKVLDTHKKIDELRQTIKRTSYAGKPTKKWRRLQQLESQYSDSALDFYRNKGLDV